MAQELAQGCSAVTRSAVATLPPQSCPYCIPFPSAVFCTHSAIDSALCERVRCQRESVACARTKPRHSVAFRAAAACPVVGDAHGAARSVAFAVGRAQLLAGMNEIIVDVYSMQAALLMPPPTVPTPSAAATDARHPQAASSQPTDGDDAARATKRAKPSEPAPAATADTASHHSELKLHAARSDSIDSLFDGVFLSTAALPPSAPDAASRQLAVVPYDGARSDAKIELLRTTVKNLLEVRARPASGSTPRLDRRARQ